MNHLKTVVLAAALSTLAGLAPGQDTNLLRTQMAVFQARTGAVLIKGVGPVGTLPLGSNQISVHCKETTDANTGEKIYGLAFGLGAQTPGDWMLVDDDEVDALLNGVNYLAKINFDVTSLPSFEASYTSKAGLRVIADSVRKEGTVRNYIQFGDYPRIPVSAVQMTQLYTLIQQGRKSLDALKAGK